MSTFTTTVLLLALAACAHTAYLTEKPDYIHTCYKSKPDFNECSKLTLQQVLKRIETGISEIGVIPFDPLEITEIRILQGSGPVSVNASLRNARIVGASDTIVNSVIVDPKTYSFSVKLTIPHLRIDGFYSMKGRILLLPLTGHGSAWYEPSDIEAEAIIDREVFEKDGLKFFNVPKIKLDFEIGKLKLRLNNLFEGNKALEESTNSYINLHSTEVAESLKGTLADAMSEIFIQVLNQVFHGIPAKFIIADV